MPLRGSTAACRSPRGESDRAAPADDGQLAITDGSTAAGDDDWLRAGGDRVAASVTWCWIRRPRSSRSPCDSRPEMRDPESWELLVNPAAPVINRGRASGSKCALGSLQAMLWLSPRNARRSIEAASCGWTRTRSAGIARLRSQWHLRCTAAFYDGDLHGSKREARGSSSCSASARRTKRLQRRPRDACQHTRTAICAGPGCTDRWSGCGRGRYHRSAECAPRGTCYGALLLQPRTRNSHACSG
jgi:hypothetical protein